MGLTWLEIVALYLVLLAVTRAVVLMPGVTGLFARQQPARPRRRRSRRAPPPRPIEAVAEDLRRLETRYRRPVRGTSYTKVEAARHAYDRVLAEACACLEIENLLGVLPPGAELDSERKRIEDSLWLQGLRFEDAA